MNVRQRPVQTLATTRNIVGPNNVVSCCAMLADVCKRSQQVTTCWVFRWEYKGLWDVFHLRRHVDFLFACICVDTWHVVRVRRRNIVGCAFSLAKSRAKWHVIRFRDYHWLSWKKHSREEQKNGCCLRIGSLLVSVLFRAIKASFNASFKWNVFLENVYVL